MKDVIREFTPEKMKYLKLPKGTEHFIKAHGSFTDIHSAITKNADIISTTDLFEDKEHERVLVEKSDVGASINETLKDLEELLWAYRIGMIR